MNERKFCFIICYNDEMYLKDALLYIEKLHIPEGYIVENICIQGAASMTSGYQEAMERSDAKYKIYMHQDVNILNHYFLDDILKIFLLSEKIGMIGMLGTKKLPPNGCMWTTPMRTGSLRDYVFSTEDMTFDIPVSKSRGYTFVDAIDGLIMVTQYDLDWRTDLFKDWDFYDVSQSMEFRKAGYRIAVPAQNIPWVLHNDDILNLKNYHKNRKIFLEEYFPQNVKEIEQCIELQEVNDKKSFDEIEGRLFSLFKENRYDDIAVLVFRQIEANVFSEKMLSLYIFSRIGRCEKQASVPTDSTINSIIEGMDMIQMNHLFKKIKLYLMREFYALGQMAQKEAELFFKDMGLSDVALACFRQLIEPNRTVEFLR